MDVWQSMKPSFIHNRLAQSPGRQQALEREAALGTSSRLVRPVNIEEWPQRYTQRYIPGHKMYLHEADPEKKASVIWENIELERPRLMIRPDIEFPETHAG